MKRILVKDDDATYREGRLVLELKPENDSGAMTLAITCGGFPITPPTRVEAEHFDQFGLAIMWDCLIEVHGAGTTTHALVKPKVMNTLRSKVAQVVLALRHDGGEMGLTEAACARDLAVMLNVPRFDDDSGYDWRAVVDG